MATGIRLYRRENAKVPKEITDLIIGTFTAAIVGQGIKEGDTLADLIQRHCPGIHNVAAGLGYEVKFDLPENDHAALCGQQMFYVIRAAGTRH